MKKIVGIICIVIAALSLFAGFSAGASALGACLLVAVVLALVGLRLLGVIGKKSKPQPPKQKPAANPTRSATAIVWVVPGSSVYHEALTCQHIHGNLPNKVPLADAKKLGLKPCKTCFPDYMPR